MWTIAKKNQEAEQLHRFSTTETIYFALINSHFEFAEHMDMNGGHQSLLRTI
jgi:hypothetical protein